MSSSKPNYYLKSPFANTVTLGARTSTHEFWKDTIKSTATSN